MVRKYKPQSFSMIESELRDFYLAIAKYVEENGGKAETIGGVAVIHLKEWEPNEYALAIRFTGEPPKEAK